MARREARPRTVAAPSSGGAMARPERRASFLTPCGPPPSPGGRRETRCDHSDTTPKTKNPAESGGVLRLLSFAFALASRGDLNGASIGAILTIGFAVFGKYSRNIVFIMIGFFIGVLVRLSLADLSLMLVVLFGTTLALIAGCFGFGWECRFRLLAVVLTLGFCTLVSISITMVLLLVLLLCFLCL